MRVLFLSPYPPERDGIGAYCARLVAELTEQGHEVGVISARPSPGAPPEVIASVPGAVKRGLDVAVISARAFAPDVVHVQFAVAAYGPRLPAVLRLIDRLRAEGMPVVITMHEVTRDTQRLRAAGRALYRRVARRADQVIVHTDIARTAFERILAGPVGAARTIAHPRAELPSSAITPVQLRHRHRLGDAPVVLFFGFIDVDKGLGDLIAAVGLLAQDDALDGARVVVAGAVRRRFGVFRIFELRDWLHLRSVRRQVAALRLQTRVSFTGFVPDDEVRAWFDTAAVVVLPYRRSEQSGVASLAAAAGTPLLTSSVGELAAMSSAEPVPPGDPRALAAQLDRFLRTGPGSREPARPGDLASRERSQHGGDLPEIAAQTTLAYRELVAAPRPLAA